MTHHLLPGDYFGELAALGIDPIRQASVVSMSECELFCLEKEDIFRVFSDHQGDLARVRQRAKSLEHQRRQENSKWRQSRKTVVKQADVRQSQRAVFPAEVKSAPESGTVPVLTKTDSADSPQHFRRETRRGGRRAAQRRGSALILANDDAEKTR